MGARAVGSNDEQSRLRAERLREQEALDAARSQQPTVPRTSEPDYNRIPNYAAPAFPVQTSAPSAFAIALKDVDDSFLDFQLSGLNARLRQGDYLARPSDVKELAEVQAEIARRKQGARGADAIGGSLAGDIAELSSASSKIESNVQRVLNATPETAEATGQAARNEIIEETETLRARYQRNEADLAAIAKMAPAARQEMTKSGVVAQLEATRSALQEQIVRNVEVAQRLSVAPVMDEAIGAAKTARDAVAFLQTISTQNKSRDVTDRQLDGEVAAHGAHLLALNEQIGALKKRESDAQAVKARIEAVPEEKRTARDSIELADATKVLDGVLPTDGKNGPVSIHEQIKTLSLIAASVSASRTQIATRYEVLARAINEQLVSLGERPTANKSIDGLLSGMRRIGELVGTTAISAPLEKLSFGQVDELTRSFLRDSTVRRVAMLEKTASILHREFGIDVLPVDAKGEPQLPMLPAKKGSKDPPVLDMNAVDAKLAQSLHALAVVTDRDKLRESDFEILAKAAVSGPNGPPLDATNPLLQDLTAAHIRLQFVSAEGLRLLGKHADLKDGKLTFAQLKQISVDLLVAPTMRETARAMLANPEFAAQMKTPGVDDGISASAFRRLAAHASESTITGHKGELPVSIFYAGAFVDAGRLRGAISAHNLDEAVAVLAKLTQPQRQMLAIAYGDSLSKDMKGAFDGADLGRIAYAVGRLLPLEERMPAELAAIGKDPSSIDRHLVEIESTLRTYERGGFSHSVLGLRRKGVFDRDSKNPETDLRDKVDAVKARRAELQTALQGKDPRTIESARTAAAKALVDCLDYYTQVTTEVGAQVAATDRFLKTSQDIATAVTVTAVATAASVATAGAATPYAGAAAATAIGVVAATLAGSATASVISALGQKIEKGHVDLGEVGGAAREGAIMGFAAGVTAGASSLAMDGVMTAVNATRVGVFLQSGTRLAAMSNVALKSAVMGGASAGGAAVGTAGGAWIRGATGDLDGAETELKGIWGNAIRGGISGALLAPFAGRFAGVRGRAFDGAVGGLEQYAWNKVLDHEGSEGVAQAIVSGVVIGGITEAHAKNVAAAKQIGLVPIEGQPVRLPAEHASPAAPSPNPTGSWKIKSVDAETGLVTVEPLTPKPGAPAIERKIGAAALLEENAAWLALARPEVDHERSTVMKRVIPDADVRTTLDADLREVRGRRAKMTPEAYKAEVEKVVGEASALSSALDEVGRVSARKRLEALPNAAHDPHVQDMLRRLDASAAPKGETEALVALELAFSAEAQIKGALARGAKLTPVQSRDAIAELLTKSGVNVAEAEIAAARRTDVAPRLEKLGSAPTHDQKVQLQKTQAAFEKAWKEAPPRRAELSALAKSAGFVDLPSERQCALLEAPLASRGVLAEELNRHGDDRIASTTLARLALSKGFQALGRGEQEQLLRYVGGTNRQLSGPARAALTQLMNHPTFQAMTPGEQHNSLQFFMNNQPGIHPILWEPPNTWKAQSLSSMSAPSDVPAINFDTGTKPAKRYEIEIDGRKISVLVSTGQPAAGLQVHTPEEVRRALELMPQAARAQVRAVHIDNSPARDDAYFQKKFGNPNHRAYMTAGKHGVVTIYPTAERYPIDPMVGTLVHEAGHLASFGRWTPSHSDSPAVGMVADPAWKPWTNAIKSDKFAVSSYAKNDPAEDFAETYRLYAQTVGTPRHAELRQIMPERFRILDQYWNGGAP